MFMIQPYIETHYADLYFFHVRRNQKSVVLAMRSIPFKIVQDLEECIDKGINVDPILNHMLRNIPEHMIPVISEALINRRKIGLDLDYIKALWLLNFKEIARLIYHGDQELLDRAIDEYNFRAAHTNDANSLRVKMGDHIEPRTITLEDRQRLERYYRPDLMSDKLLHIAGISYNQKMSRLEVKSRRDFFIFHIYFFLNS